MGIRRRMRRGEREARCKTRRIKVMMERKRGVLERVLYGMVR